MTWRELLNNLRQTITQSSDRGLAKTGESFTHSDLNNLLAQSEQANEIVCFKRIMRFFQDRLVA